ncbi:hypothetical protein ACFQL1_15980 [Halomicroarcula sp. GCM10025709]|uniref:hypothetical protein n=1 Tax=Haloarcula TaxID=2237 RepID=UPI0024C2A139|nr:hypothetical protein [Halomicroarcula sp. YJ-61-S]
MSEHVLPANVCPHCGGVFEQLANHWAQSATCVHPTLTQEQRELLKGLVMGDGSISNPKRGSGDSRMRVTSTNERWLRWLRAQFGPLATEPTLDQTGEELGRKARSNPSFDDSGGDWEYSDIYRMSVRSHPYLTMMRKRWYPDGEIRYPDDLHLTPLAAKAWYCSDGGISWTDSAVFAAFGTHNEADRPGFLCDLFREHGFTARYSEPLVRVSSTQTEDLLEWMGTAPAGFAYKWESQSRQRYDRLKMEVTG